ncbi:MAG: hypothetical protein FWD11_08045, partial [Micrococcales bacterium]|nr:hypothetical protein [Micrococcales bacterium]
MLSDAEIESSLGETVVGAALEVAPLSVRRMPYPGEWLSPPYPGDDVAVVARDENFSELRVDRRTGRVEGVDLDSGDTQLIAPSLADLGTLAEAYADAFRRTARASDWKLRRIEKKLLRAVRRVAPELAVEDSFWAFAAEEIGYGVIGADDVEPPMEEPTALADGPTTVIAMSMQKL